LKSDNKKISVLLPLVFISAKKNCSELFVICMFFWSSCTVGRGTFFKYYLFSPRVKHSITVYIKCMIDFSESKQPPPVDGPTYSRRAKPNGQVSAVHL